MASASPESASRAAVSMFCAAARPASRSPGALAPSSQPPTMRISASSGCRNAFRTTSGPMPRGSPTATARRGRGGGDGAKLESDIDVNLPPQLIYEMPDRQLVTQRLPNPDLHVVEREITGVV